MHNSPHYSKREAHTPLFGVSIVAVVLLIIMGFLVQAIREALATEVSVEIGKPISLLSNQALGPVLHSLIQMRVQGTGLAKLDLLPPFPSPPVLPLPHTHTLTQPLSRPPSQQPYLVLLTIYPHCSPARLKRPLLIKVMIGQRAKNVFGAIKNSERRFLYHPGECLPV